MLGLILGVSSFVIGALAAAGIVDMGVAQIMLLAALILASVGTFVVEWLSGRSRKRIMLSTVLVTIGMGVLLFGIVNPWMVRKKQDQERVAQQPINGDLAKNPPVQAKPAFSVRLNSTMIFKFIGPLLCVYRSDLGDTIAPVNIAINVEVASLKPGRARIYTYKAKALITYNKDGQMLKETFALSTIPIGSCGVYFITKEDWTTAKNINFSTNDFDLN
ncbi:MAG TPA: hypothetical protein VF762_02075, partial [Blastocatellia bacterium]